MACCKSDGKRRKIIADLILILAILFVALSVFLCLELTREGGRAAVVYVNGEKAFECPLDKDGEYPVLDGKNVVAVRGGEVYMHSADCPDKHCVKMGKKSLSGQSIDCLPNRVRVVVIGGDGEILEVG